MWFAPLLTVMQVGERTIIESTAHAEAITLFIKSNQRHEDKIKRFDPEQAGTAFMHGFVDAKTVAVQLCARCIGQKPEAAAVSEAEYR